MSRDRFPAGANGKTREAWARRKIALAFGMKPHQAQLFLQGAFREAFGQGKRAGVALAALSRTEQPDAAAVETGGFIDIVFDGPPGPESGRFIEVEDANGKSVDAGIWREREGGLWAFRVACAKPSGGLVDAVERVLLTAQPVTERQGDENVVIGYRHQTGAIHALLTAVRECGSSVSMQPPSPRGHDGGGGVGCNRCDDYPPGVKCPVCRAKHPSEGERAVVGGPEHVALWDAINAYAAACGGRTAGAGSAARMGAVAQVEAALAALAPREAGGTGEATDLSHALSVLTDEDRALFPLNLQPDGRAHVRLAHVEPGEGSPRQGDGMFSVPAKFERVAWAMVCALNAALAAERGERGSG